MSEIANAVTFNDTLTLDFEQPVEKYSLRTRTLLWAAMVVASWGLVYCIAQGIKALISVL